MKTNLIVVAILTALVGIFYFDVLFLNKAFISNDANEARFLSYSVFLEFNENQTDWYPYIFSGMPTTLLYRSALNYFPNIILQAFPTIFQHLIHYILAGFGMFLLLRHLGILSGLVGAISFIFCANMITQEVVGHAGLWMTAAYIPIIFWSMRQLLDGKQNIAVTALFIGLQLQRQHLQIAYYTWILMGLYVTWWFWQERDIKRLSMFGASCVLGLMLGAIHFLPIHEYAKYSVRDYMSVEYASRWSLHPLEMITFVWPFAYGWGGTSYTGHLPFTYSPHYLGIIVIALAGIGVYVRRRDTYCWFICFVISLFMIISFGKYTPVHGFLFEWLPMFSKFRVPIMILILVQFLVSVLAAFGFHWVYGKLKQNKVGYIAYILAFLVLADLWYIGNKITKPSSKIYQTTGDVKFRKDEIASFFEKDENLYRVHFEEFNTNKYARWGVEMTGGYHAAKLVIYQKNFIEEKDPIKKVELLKLLNVKYVVSRKLLNIKLLIKKTLSGYYIHRFPGNPRYFLKNGSIERLEHDNNYRKMELNAFRDDKLIISEIYYPAWKAFVDGKEVTVEKYKNLICAVPIKIGHHTVEFKYVSHIYMISVIISLLGLLAIIIIRARGN